VSVAVAALVAREFVLGTNWKNAYDKAAANFQKALEERDMVIQQLDDDRRAREADKTAADAKINVLTDELNLRNNTIKTLTAEKVSQDKRLEDLAAQFAGIKTSFEALMRDKTQWQNERDTATKKADQLTVMLSELENRYRAAQADNATLKETLRQAREEKAALEAQLAWVNTNHPEVKFPSQVPAVPQGRVQGLVTKADNEAKVAEINLGSDAGVVKGMKFFIYNTAEMKYLATLTINMVSNTSAAGELSVIRGTVKVNDHVTNRFE
jgi:hypothetical protein